MASHEDKKGDYEIGYGKPPKHSQWKKGQSGNPSGKRKREEGMAEVLKRIVEEEIVVSQNGTQTVMPQLEAILRALLSKASKGDVRAFKFVKDVLGSEATSEGAPPQQGADPADLETLQTHADWVRLLEEAKRPASHGTEAGDMDEGGEAS
jgi:hypothetical protein